MIKILFVCHGNICRSPMAEFLFKDIIKKQKLEHMFTIASAATSTEEIGNPVHRGTKGILRRLGISSESKRAVQMQRSDYDEYDYLIGMDDWNIRNMRRIAGGDPDGKIYKLMEFAGSSREVADPWYTGDFETTYQDIMEGCQGLLQHLLQQQKEEHTF